MGLPCMGGRVSSVDQSLKTCCRFGSTWVVVCKETSGAGIGKCFGRIPKRTQSIHEMMTSWLMSGEMIRLIE